MSGKHTRRSVVGARMITTILSTILMFGACDDECRNLPNAIEHGEDGRSWAQHGDWDVAAHAWDQEGFEQGMTLEIFEPAEGPEGVECWRFGSPGDYATICKLPTTCYDLYAIPVTVVVQPGGECPGAPEGAWDYTIDAAFGCYGVFDELGLAVKLRL